MLKVYIMAVMVLVGLCFMTYRYLSVRSVISQSQSEKGVSVKHKSENSLRMIKLSIAWLFITGGNILLNMSELNDSYRDAQQIRTRLLFYTIAFCAFLILGLIYNLYAYNKFAEFKLCETCFYCCGSRYSKERYSYSLEGSALIFSAPHMKHIKVDIPKEKLAEVTSILERHYTKKAQAEAR